MTSSCHFAEEKYTLAPGVGVDSGFEGCISDIRISRHEIDLVKSVVDAANVEDCDDANPCEADPCKNGGTCSQDDKERKIFHCKCPSEWR